MSAKTTSQARAHLLGPVCSRPDHVRMDPMGSVLGDVLGYLPVNHIIAQVSGTKTRSISGLMSIKPINAASTKSQVPIVVPSLYRY